MGGGAKRGYASNLKRNFDAKKVGLAAIGIGAGATGTALCAPPDGLPRYRGQREFERSGNFDKGYDEERGRELAATEMLLYNRTAHFISFISPIISGAITKAFTGEKGPELLIDSSISTKTGFLFRLTRPFRTAAKREPLDMVLSTDGTTDPIIEATQSARQQAKDGVKGVVLQSYLLYGPPGTGKTMRAKKIAQECGMGFAVISGASLFKFNGQKAIEEIDTLFKYAQSNKNGTVIVIDEVDALLLKRELVDPTSDQYKFITNLLTHTGTRTSNHMLIMTTNHKELLDSAVLSRVDQHIHMGLPDQATREKVLNLHINKTFFDEKNNLTLNQQSREALLSPQAMTALAIKTEGYSNRDLQGFVNTLFIDASRKQTISPEQIDKTLEQMKEKVTLTVPQRLTRELRLLQHDWAEKSRAAEAQPADDSCRKALDRFVESGCAV